MEIAIFVESYFRGGLDTFLMNLIKEWPEKAQFKIYVNKTHPGIQILKNELSNKDVEFKLYGGLSVRHKRGIGWKRKLSWNFTRALPSLLWFRYFNYILMFPYYLLSNWLIFFKDNRRVLIVVNGSHPGSLRCLAAVFVWKMQKRYSKRIAILTVHSMRQSLENSIHRLIQARIDKKLEEKSDAIVTVSEACLHSLESEETFRKSNKLTYILNGITPQEKCRELSHGETKSNDFVMLATYHANKGHVFALKAFRVLCDRYPNSVLSCFGDGPEIEREKLRILANNMNLHNNVRFYGHIKEVGEKLGHALALVVPSQSHESFGIVLIEAMSLGIPIVATNVGGIPEVLNDGGGILCEPNDHVKFAEHMIKIIEDDTLRMSLIESGKSNFAKNFQASIMSSRYYDLIKKINQYDM